MSHPDDDAPLLDQLRELPTEVSLEQVDRMVAAFPIATGLTLWLATLRTNLNTILMSITGTLLVGAGIHLFSGGDPATTTTQLPLAGIGPELEAPLPAAPEEAPAVVLTIPTRGSAGQVQPAPSVAAPSPPPNAIPPVEPPTVPMAVLPPPAVSHAPTLPDAPVRQPKAANERRFDLRDFTGIKVVSAMNVTLEVGDFSVTATGPEEALQQLDVQVKNGVLELDYLIVGRSRRTCGPMDFTVRMPLVHLLDVMGSGSLHGTDLPTTAKLDLNVMGSGNITLERVPDATALKMSVRGSGSIRIEDVGTTEAAEVNVVGSGVAEVGRMAQAGSLKVLVAGSGVATCERVNVTGTSTLWVTGSGDLTASGTTGRVDVTVTGSGNVRASELNANGGKVAVIGSGDAFVHSEGPLQLQTQGSGTIHTTGSAGGLAPQGVGSGAH